MAKRRAIKKDVRVDMTAMTDVSFLLLTFFILTAKFRPNEAVAIDTPASRAEQKVPDDLFTISVDKEGNAYFGMSVPRRRIATLNSMIERYGQKYPVLKTLTEDQITKFGNVETFGYKINQLPSLLDLSPAEINSDKGLTGIPRDTSDNQLGDWINAARASGVNEGIDIPIAIKGDQNANVDAVKDIINILKDRDIYRFNLITTLGTKVN
ncbi:MAG: biopolymer transporter ExbD [Chitinophagales bacterium]|nr:biopolymer transporter ExbD [Chitinophagales bacterium]